MTPARLYQERLSNGQIKPDAGQAEIIHALERLHQDLIQLQPRPSRIGKLLGKKPELPKGVYIYGAVGRGKSMAMDLFFECAPIAKKRRVHFHAFMQELHRALHLGRQKNPQAMDSALQNFARHVAHETRLLCFDEFHVVDVADAMLLGRLFQSLWDLGVVIVATSNWPPDDLYKDGLQRDRFLPFIAALKRNLQICHLQSDTDYRLARLRGHPVYYAPLGPHQAEQMNFLFDDLTQGAEITPLELQLQGRRWLIRRAAKGIAWLDFTDACADARGAPDYLALAQNAQVVFLDQVPRFDDDMRNEVKRLMTLIDILYENHVRIVMGAETEPQKLYVSGHHSFEFERTVSRLMEMQSAEYLKGAIGGH
ncbi:MAG TPA: cell division protein ZapE [Alphaproteobacteria bacterium]|nr:cell division protein ZapE [Rhodospirillaceae bacterium]HRJ11861.1 cell division protein ZapE [Alphaproteobacteria bacterium]